MSDLTKQIEDLLKETGKAHHQAFIKVDGDDPEWPLWYAEYIQEKLGKLLNTQFTQSELVHLIMLAEDERGQNAPDAAWPEYYAKVFVSKYK